ncbi:uncharacterized protein LOC101213037 isoform X2 [Cucumis sativus]|uniref:uncharacterized protein LOC101213037 isoform X2 n=1 Tax=Cucumis sativus TaxID=3659 RepID=UPI0012F4A873|nr:uncharacterized protein LOC101213037 isoform X2 [Cucumis sativus]
MIQVALKLVLAEMALILALLFKNPLRNLIVKGLDRLKQGRGPLVVKSVAATMLVVFASALYNAAAINRRVAEAGILNQTDEILVAYRLLETYTIGNMFGNRFLVIPCIDYRQNTQLYKRASST